MMPTILTILNIDTAEDVIYDGIDVMPLITGKISQRPMPIGFQSPLKNKGDQWANKNATAMTWSGNRHKLVSVDNGETYQLYDLINDPSVKNDVAQQHPEVVNKMSSELEAWVQSCNEDVGDL